MICDECTNISCWLRGGLTLGSTCKSFTSKEVEDSPLIAKIKKLNKTTIDMKDFLEYDSVIQCIKDNM